jgi:metallophosphoesterase (TIGR00282 family)
MIFSLKVLFIGDVFGDPGRKAVSDVLPTYRVENEIDLCIANCENASSRGSGISAKNAKELFASGIDFMTMGNHCWKHKDIFNLLEESGRIIRPANYPDGNPGSGAAIVETARGDVGVVNLAGRIFMDYVDCPFRAADREVERLRKHTKLIIVDMHAEASSEKCAMAYYLDGRASFVAGTHTHVQTADERIFPNGTGFISDVGMTGPHDSIIGIEKDAILKKLTMLLPVKFEPAGGRMQFNAILITVDDISGKTVEIERINKVLST